MQDNRKTRYTKKVIYESLTELSRQKPLNKVTVKELCELADINRSTFYAYYETLEQLIREVEVSTAQKLIDSVHEENYQNSDFKEKAVTGFLDLLVSDPDVCFWILDDNVTGAGKQKIHDETERAFVSHWVTNGKIGEKQAHYLFEYIFEGAMGQITRWYRNREEISLDELREIFTEVTQNTISLVH